MRTHKKFFAVLSLLALSALPAAAVDNVIYSGIDPLITKGDGGSFTDFSKKPIPAGFFCSKSEPFTGRIVWTGIPLVTNRPGELGRSDTIIHRLDDAVFNKAGVAVTRIQVGALRLQSIAPIKTSCGRFNVYVTVDGEQPITRMRIIREHENGGRFLAPIAVRAKLSFVPVSGKVREPLEIPYQVRFPATPSAKWAARPGEGGIEKTGFVAVDTDGDLQTDTYLPGTSNFAAGWTASPGKAAISEDCDICHEDAADMCSHCVSGGGPY